MKIRPARRIEGDVQLPGDKSISHRAALVASLAQGTSHIANFSTSQDCASTLSCLAKLGVQIKRNGSDVEIQGVGDVGFTAPKEALDCGNSGSTMRMLAGILAGQEFSSTLTGDDSLRARPMRRIIEPLEMMGARVFSDDGRAPLRIEGKSGLIPISYDLPIASAQVKTCLLLAGLSAEGQTEVNDRLGVTRDHTERLLQLFGVPISTSQNGEGEQTSAVIGPAQFWGRPVNIPGDFSAAAYLIAAAALLPGSELVIEEIGLNVTRTKFLETLRSFGADIEVVEEREESNEPRGTVRIRGRRWLQSTGEISGKTTAALIDELPLLAVVGSQLSRGLVIRDASELRTKESDRLSATAANLRAMGVDVNEYDDGLALVGPTRLRGARVDSHQDHRIAMAFSIAALLAQCESEIIGSECVAVSFPEFFEVLNSVVER
ncbi:MAG: 3-phosphoshikimate 1-carboxyvinyltransferase [Acidobacteriota bacterium]|nr:3-phosphoshikimate 1-carboxyvinyltransferase [Acidobacteriota bacterium]